MRLAAPMFFNKRLIAAETGQRSPAISLTTRIGSLALRRSKSEADTARAAYEVLLEPCWDPLWRYAYNSTSHVEDARDLLSETVLEGFKSFGQFRGETSFLRWMYRVMRTTHIDMLRRSKRHEVQSLDIMQEDGSTRAFDIADEASDPERIVLGPMLSEPVQKALSELSDEFRAVVVLADMEQLDYSVVSDILQIPIGTVRSRLHRARSLLRKSLAAYVEPPW
jgi:RNA polymerase sigma-70 factor (ECF subfamily)